MRNKIIRRETSVAVAMLAGVVLSCGTKIDPVSGLPEEDLPATVTYTDHIKPLLERSCTSCHASTLEGANRNGAPAGVDYDTYGYAVQGAERGNARVQAGTMPPVGGLSSEDRALFQEWIDQGLPE